VLTHHAAALVTYWPTVRLHTVTLAAPTRKAARAGYAICRRAIPSDQVVERDGLRCTAPALTALDLIDCYGGEAIDVLLRSRRATLQQLYEALATTAHRRGNQQRRRLVLESRENPWSPPERLAHRLLWDAGITGWVGNLRVVVHGHPYYVDIGFPKIKLAVEIDGREFHTAAADFEKDRWRQNDLVNAGWRVLRFTARMLEEAPQLVLSVITEALAG
jgi:very-short-patch-repair endonuclease